MWDLYNEVTNGFLPGQAVAAADRQAAFAAAVKQRAESMPDHLRLLDLAFEWARAAAPSQPLTAGLFMPRSRAQSTRLARSSDVITLPQLRGCRRGWRRSSRGCASHERPLICTEYMARTHGCDFASQLPVFKREHVGCYNWGLVNGKTQTHIAWTGESDRWFHDIFHADGSPYDAEEVAFIREITGAGNAR